MIGAIVAALTRPAQQDERLAQLETLVGRDGVDAALDLAVEGAKMGLRVKDLQPAVEARQFLRYLGNEPTPGQGFIAWALQHGYVTRDQIIDAENLDILGMNEEPDAPDESTFEQRGDEPDRKIYVHERPEGVRCQTAWSEHDTMAPHEVRHECERVPHPDDDQHVCMCGLIEVAA